MNEALKAGKTGQWRELIQSFILARLEAKLEKMAEDDPKRPDLIAQYQVETWLAAAARRVEQIRAATHTLKAIHPDARGTNLFVRPQELCELVQLSSHVLTESFTFDVVGNAGALDIYKFLSQQLDGHSLLDRLQAKDPTLLAAFCDHPDQAQEWASAFLGLLNDGEQRPVSHVLAKQLYWLMGTDGQNDEHYHLLAPLFPSSLVHAVYAKLREYQFDKQVKQGRDALYGKKMHDGVVHVYPRLAIRKLGSTKPQTVSQLNMERGGVNYLLSSLPPRWTSRSSPSPWGVESIFDSLLMQRREVRQQLGGLRRFLQSQPKSIKETRDRVDDYLARLIDELVSFAAELRTAWPAGWTADSRCQLAREEQLWLDIERVRQEEVFSTEADQGFRAEWYWMDWPDQIGQRFARWINGRLDGCLPVGDVEYLHWKKELLVDQTHWADQLQTLRRQVPLSKTRMKEEA
ncbi:type I-F CRISPR-associated protein Csy1 [Alcaligenes faecalis]|uniref:type I-F CRISPR-associated protein Csy1 n=1 Tax=Alcaligenes faecalis TaxID=511 RepID=UPI000A2DBC9A|nr:type I-F CRISPR-associated protein Csy1 [Alcaligenes faecalis]OSZ42564.1 type I-F CRISPR-associated protein Csy1 [Alcaligenes faecalis]OSZ52251.1 type I-F CRISPR-associated protein Csy1 [Alcaligenes faecalis]OSZ54460.1 type I-F CRISPR-associated protein Csy1 [Alcaligenes faecalis]